MAISYSKLGEIHQSPGQLDSAFELRCQLSQELYASNPKNVELKNGLAISYYKLGNIATDPAHAQTLYQQAIVLWQELHALTRMPIFQQYIDIVQSLLDE